MSQEEESKKRVAVEQPEEVPAAKKVSNGEAAASDAQHVTQRPWINQNTSPLQTADPYCLDSSDAFKEGEMSYVQCPAEYDGQRPTLFLAGGISNCADWQVPLRDLVHSMCPGLVPVNPRRENFDVSKPEMTEEQIKWEFKQLRKAAAIVFWFPRETLCPITLYELGTWSVLHKMHGCDIFVGTDPEYARKEDVKIQLCLATDTDFPVVHSIEELAQQLQGWWKDHTSVAN